MSNEFERATAEYFECSAPAQSDKGITRYWKDNMRPILMLGVPVLLAVVAAATYLAVEPYVATDNAYARVAKVSINARVSGQVVEIAVADNQPVRKGQVLFRINPEPLQIAVDRAQAQLRVARLHIQGLRANYRQQTAESQAAQASAEFDRKELARKQALLATKFVSRGIYERAETDLRVAQQRVVSVEQQIASTVVALNGDPNAPVDNNPTVSAAKAQLDEAQLYLTYATVYAPEDGIVAKVDDLQVGDYVHSGTPTFALLSSRQIWVEANFRETEVTHMRPGQAATVNIDTYPGHTFKAHIVSLSPGAGSDFAMLPPENATGNWVKVVQRVPVRLELDQVDPDRPLYSGTSARVEVDTGYRASWWKTITTQLIAGNDT